MNFKSSFLRELNERGFIAQITHEAELDAAFASGKVTAYIGFDCTASSLHVGSLIQLMILRLLKKHGHNPVVLLGGGTTKIGDPSGKDQARQILSASQITDNLSSIKSTISKFIADAIFVNNDEWLSEIKYLDFLRDIGRHFSVNQMLTFESVKLRLERSQPLSFIEFNYMILQAYDFLILNRKLSCALQIGGSDQWGNIVNGVELIRRVDGKQAFGLTSPLLETADGKKMGKTADGAVWLDANLLAAFDYFQYFRNTDDRDVFKFLCLFTELELAEITELKNSGNINLAKERLAFEATKIAHGRTEAETTLATAREIFVNKNHSAGEILEIKIPADQLAKGKRLVEIIREAGILPSASEARRMIKNNGVKINEVTVTDENLIIRDLTFDLAIGKKKFYKIIIKLY